MIEIHLDTQMAVEFSKLLINESKKNPKGIITLSLNSTTKDKVDIPFGISYSKDIEIE